MKRILVLLVALAMLFVVSAQALTMSVPGEFPIADETIPLSVLITKISYVTDYEDNTFTKLIEDTCGVDLSFVFLPESDPFTKLNVMVSSGETLPDIISYGLGLSDTYNFASAGAIVPIDEYIEQYGVNMKANLDKLPDLMVKQKITAADGHIYGVPLVFYASTDSIWQNCWINKNWLSKLNLAMPTTPDELHDVLVAFRDSDPNGNGEKDEIPLTGATLGGTGSKNAIAFLLNSYVYWNAPDRLNVDNGIVFATYMSDAWKEGVLYVKKLLAEGLIDSQIFTQSADQELALAMKEGTSIVGAFMNMSPRKGNEYTYMMPLTGPGGKHYCAYDPGQVSGYWFITSDCKYPEAAFRVGDFLFSGDDELNLTMRYGEKGVYWDWATNNENIKSYYPDKEAIYYIPLDKKGVQMDVWNTQAAQHWKRNNPCFFYGLNDYRGYDQTVYVDDLEINLINDVLARETVDAIRAACLPPNDEYIPFITYNVEETDIYNDIRPELYAYVDESLAAFLTGSRDIEAEWGSYIATLKSLGVDEFLAVVQRAYDRMYK